MWMTQAGLALSRRGAVAACLGLAGATAAAETLDARFWLRLGAFRPDIDTTARIDEAGGTALGTQFSFEDLGLPRKKTLPTLLMGLRLGSDWRAEFEYFQLRREGRTTLDRNLTIDDTTFPVSAELSSRLQSDVYRLSGGYSFVHLPHAELGVVLGLHVTRFDARLQGTVSTPGQPVASATEQERQTVPLPTLGLYGAFAIAPGWQATARADYFSLKHSDLDGRLINAQANVVYRAATNLGIGAGWRYDDYRVDSTRSAFRGRVEYRFQGPQVFLEASF